MQELIQFLEEYTDVEDIEFVAQLDGEYLFTGFFEGEDEPVEINVTFTNYVYINDVEQNLYLPFNVWSL